MIHESTGVLLRLVVGMAALATILLAACGSDRGGTGDYLSSADAALDDFVQFSTAGIVFDYRPLASPEYAIDEADAVVVGRMTRYLSGAEAVYVSGRPGSRFLLIEVLVDRVLRGDSMMKGRSFVLAQLVSPVSSVDPAAAALPTGSSVMILWTYDESLFFEQALEVTGWPEGQVFGAFTDGLWFQTESGDFRGVHATKQELESRWGPISSFDALVEMLESAGVAVAR